jgi:hypothetical protein
VLVQNEDGTTERISDKLQMETSIISRNIMHFSQADGSPFTKEPLTDLFGRYGVNLESELLLDGELDIESVEVTEPVKKILRRLRRVVPKGTVSNHLTTEDVKQCHVRWNEGTSTSPSGLHLGHEKAVLRMEATAKEGKVLLSDRVFALKVAFLNLAIEHCNVYKRWEKIVNATIEKIPGTPQLHKLRVIHLIESDFNLMIGILWGRRLMQQAEANGSLGVEQHGSVKGKDSIGLLHRTTLKDKHCII